MKLENNKPLCIINIMNNEQGLKISEEILEWLEPIYEVHKIYHDGSQYEYPGMKYMQDLCIKEKRPCLYLHTKGAVNTRPETEDVRKLWKHEFTKNYQTYFNIVNIDSPQVACPLTGNLGFPWFNGFVTNYQALQKIPSFEPCEDKGVFNQIFGIFKVPVYGVVRNDVNWCRYPESMYEIREIVKNIVKDYE